MAERSDDGPDLTVRDLMAVIGRRTYGPLLLLIGLFSISPATIVPGMTWFAAAIALFFGFQLMMGLRSPWIPRSWCEARLRRDAVGGAAAAMEPWAGRIDAVLRPRLMVLADAPFANLIGAFCVIAAIATFPLGLIPMAPLAPGIAILIMGSGLFARDGLLLLAGFVVAASALALSIAAIM
ncbi:MAG: exopolysaccharide biosynthesis protein [Hyphomonadaceae bacterium]|nr:exopolysaccharide biosynthesis protein [Hyphomonadaceae bacterium]